MSASFFSGCSTYTLEGGVTCVILLWSISINFNPYTHMQPHSLVGSLNIAANFSWNSGTLPLF
jgi:hypothetical protein